MAERLARSKQTAGAFCESSLLRMETYGNWSPKSTNCRLANNRESRRTFIPSEKSNATLRLARATVAQLMLSDEKK